MGAQIARIAKTKYLLGSLASLSLIFAGCESGGGSGAATGITVQDAGRNPAGVDDSKGILVETLATDTEDGGKCIPFKPPSSLPCIPLPKFPAPLPSLTALPFPFPSFCPMSPTPSSSPSPSSSATASPSPSVSVTPSPSATPSTTPSSDPAGSCYLQRYEQDKESVKVKNLDVIFVVDSSGSLNEERKKISDNIGRFIQELPTDLDIQFGVILGHSSKSKWAGQFYSVDKKYTFLSTKKHSLSTIKTQLLKNLNNTPSDGAADGGEELFYSLNKAFDTAIKSRSNCQAFFRQDAALAVIFVSDENEISTFPISKVYDPDKKEGSAYNRDYKNKGITPDSLIAKAKTLVRAKPFIFGGIIYTTENTYPKQGENELGLGYLELLEKSSGIAVDLAQKDFSSALSQIGKACREKIELKTRFRLSNLPVDAATIEARVDTVKKSHSFENGDTVVLSSSDAGRAGSKIEISYCTIKPDPFTPATLLGWSTSSPTSETSFQAQWKKSSSSAQLLNQRIQFFEGRTCNTAQGEPVNLNSALAESLTFEATPGLTYTFKVISEARDGSTLTSECSPEMEVVKVDQPVLAATSLRWSESSPTTATTIHAAWNPSVSVNLGSQFIELYDGSTCQGTLLSRTDLESTSLSEFTISNASAGHTYSFKIETLAASGKSALSSCSPDLSVESVIDPELTPATQLGWIQSSPQTQTEVTARWIPSSSPKARAQKIQYYSDAACSTPTGSARSLSAVSTSQDPISGTLGSVMTYKILTLDELGAVRESQCSSPMVIQCLDPFDPACGGGGTGV